MRPPGHPSRDGDSRRRAAAGAGVMAAHFGGARVVLLESRMAAETAAIVRRLGGDPVSAPSLSEVDVDADEAVLSFIDRLSATRESVVVFLTGAAVTRL